jgi:hypothetical protein
MNPEELRADWDELGSTDPLWAASSTASPTVVSTRTI